MYFLHRADTDTYLTLHSEDEQNFYDIVNSNLFAKENKFRLIKNKNEIKKILEDKYSSKNRSSEYTAGLPSATLVSSALFPYNLDKNAKHNKTALLKWHNDIDVQDLQCQKITNKLSTDSGEFCHEILELALMDKQTRTFIKKRSLNNYIEKICQTEKINKIIDNFDDRKDYFVNMATKTLSYFFENELPKIDAIACELFLKNKGLQGAIDCLAYKDKKLYILDHKTSKKSMSYNQAPEKGYWRQLYLYSRMLLKENIISKKEYENLHFQINFFNWNSGKSAIYEIPKSDIDRHAKGYCEFILKWYYKMRDMNIDIHEVI